MGSIARNCDWFMVLFVCVVIGRSNCFGFVFFDSHLKTALLKKIKFTFLNIQVCISKESS